MPDSIATPAAALIARILPLISIGPPARVVSIILSQSADQPQHRLPLVQGGDHVEQPIGDIRRQSELAVQGNAKAQYNLGNRYYKGEGVPRNYTEAAKWFRLAAEQGDATAQHILGVRYAKGEGAPQSFVVAHMWLNLAASQGQSNATEHRDITAGQMTLQQIAEAQKLAAEWKPKTWDELKRQLPK